jgi:hypothetical protein
MAATHATAQHVAASSMLGPAAWAVGGLALDNILTLPKTLGKKIGTGIQTVLNGDFDQWTGDVLQKAFDELLDPKKFTKCVGASMRGNVLIPGVVDTFGNPVEVEDLKDEVGLLEKIADEVHTTNSIGMAGRLNY